MSAPVTISHDAFGRWCLLRESVPAFVEWPKAPACQWCGGRRPHGGLFRYGTAPDDAPGRISWDRRLFCSVGCYRSYHA